MLPSAICVCVHVGQFTYFNIYVLATNIVLYLFIDNDRLSVAIILSVPFISVCSAGSSVCVGVVASAWVTMAFTPFSAADVRSMCWG